MATVTSAYVGAYVGGGALRCGAAPAAALQRCGVGMNGGQRVGETKIYWVKTLVGASVGPALIGV